MASVYALSTLVEFLKKYLRFFILLSVPSYCSPALQFEFCSLMGKKDRQNFIMAKTEYARLRNDDSGQPEDIDDANDISLLPRISAPIPRAAWFIIISEPRRNSLHQPNPVL